MTKTLPLLALTLAFATATATTACKNEKEGEGSSSSTPSGPMFVGKAPGMPGPLGTLKFGMTEDEAKAAIPVLFKDEEINSYGSSTRTLNSGNLGDLFVSLTWNFGALSTVQVSVPKTELANAKKAWGEPTVASVGSSETETNVWLNAETGVRAHVSEGLGGDDLKLEVGPFISYAQLAAIGDDALSFNASTVLGATAEELVKNHPRFVTVTDKNSKSAKMTKEMMKGLDKDLKKMGIKPREGGPDVSVQLPSTPFSDHGTLVSVHFGDDNRVRGYSVNVSANNTAKLAKDIQAAFDKAWGPAKELEKTLGKTQFWYDEKGGFRASARFGGKFASKSSITIEFVRYMPLATLFGEPGVKWGVEKAPIIGSTIEEIKAAYGTNFVADKRGGGKLVFAKTDYEDDVATTNIYLRTKEDKVTGYYFGLEYRGAPTAKEEFMALLLAKFGEPKKSARESVYNKKNPKIWVRDSDITNELTIEAR